MVPLLVYYYRAILLLIKNFKPSTHKATKFVISLVFKRGNPVLDGLVDYRDHLLSSLYPTIVPSCVSLAPYMIHHCLKHQTD